MRKTSPCQGQLPIRLAGFALEPRSAGVPPAGTPSVSLGVGGEGSRSRCVSSLTVAAPLETVPIHHVLLAKTRKPCFPRPEGRGLGEIDCSLFASVTIFVLFFVLLRAKMYSRFIMTEGERREKLFLNGGGKVWHGCGRAWQRAYPWWGIRRWSKSINRMPARRRGSNWAK